MLRLQSDGSAYQIDDIAIDESMVVEETVFRVRMDSFFTSYNLRHMNWPELQNREMEGMMTYLNAFHDATLLNPDILMACVLKIKVPNKMLMEIESAVSDENADNHSDCFSLRQTWKAVKCCNLM